MKEEDAASKGVRKAFALGVLTRLRSGGQLANRAWLVAAVQDLKLIRGAGRRWAPGPRGG